MFPKRACSIKGISSLRKTAQSRAEGLYSLPCISQKSITYLSEKSQFWNPKCCFYIRHECPQLHSVGRHMSYTEGSGLSFSAEDRQMTHVHHGNTDNCTRVTISVLTEKPSATEICYCSNTNVSNCHCVRVTLCTWLHVPVLIVIFL